MGNNYTDYTIMLGQSILLLNGKILISKEDNAALDSVSIHNAVLPPYTVDQLFGTSNYSPRPQGEQAHPFASPSAGSIERPTAPSLCMVSNG